MLKNSWLFPIIQSIHLAGIAMFVGTTVLINLQILGSALQQHPASELRRRFARWSTAGLVIMLTTGPVLFLADVPRYVRNPAFLVKMVVLAVALITHFVPSGATRRRAILSLALWSAVVLAGRAIADFDI